MNTEIVGMSVIFVTHCTLIFYYKFVGVVEKSVPKITVLGSSSLPSDGMVILRLASVLKTIFHQYVI